MAGTWVSLFSGGKDSSWALYEALRSDRMVSHLLTVHPPSDSYLYHVPSTELAGLAAEAIGLPLLEVSPAEWELDEAAAVGDRGDAELEPLERRLAAHAEQSDLEGIVAGAVESAFQTDRLRAMADRLGLELYAPLFGGDHRALGEAMIEAGFDIRIVRVAAAGLDASWLGRRLDASALASLEELAKTHGVHILGEGGEYETLVVDGPHMDKRIAYESSIGWHGTHGDLAITEAWLAPSRRP